MNVCASISVLCWCLLGQLYHAFGEPEPYELIIHLPAAKLGPFKVLDTDTIVGDDTIREVQRFRGSMRDTDHFKTLMIENSSMVLGARNMIYNISLGDMREQWRIEWKSTQADIDSCKSGRENLENNESSAEECQNYIRVIQRISEDELFVCGTNAYKPYCHTYKISAIRSNEENEPTAVQRGSGKCPHDPKENNTALYIGSRLYTATTADRQSRDALLFGSHVGETRSLVDVRTQQYDSQSMNEPNQVHAFDYEDKVYFLFSETAVEYINCGKKRFSRIGRVCKNDQGGKYVLRNTWSSFFKARLNCSIPGDYPFYLDEIQSSSDIGKGNYMPSIHSSENNRTDMFYAVFNTPENSIHGSAVCAFRMSDVLSVFEGPFKEQKQTYSNWLPVSEMETPHPHPAKTCSNDSQQISDATLNFIKTHPLMDNVVPSFGGLPVFTQASISYRLTKIAIDWQVEAADGKYYDVIFVGTDDGRVIKTINRGSHGVENIVIEDIQVFQDKSPVINLKVYRNDNLGESKLIVVSEREVKAIPLQRCHLQDNCANCIALQDPYCSWADKRCMKNLKGLQSIDRGYHKDCPEKSTPPPVPETTTPTPTCPPCPLCSTDATPGEGELKSMPVTPKPNRTDSRMMNTIYEGPQPTQVRNDIPIINQHKTDPQASQQMDDLQYSSSQMAIAVVLSVIISLIIGFVGGFFFKTLYEQRIRQRRKVPTHVEEPLKTRPIDNNVHKPTSTPPNLYEVDTDTLKKTRNTLRQNEHSSNLHTDNHYEPHNMMPHPPIPYEKPQNNTNLNNTRLNNEFVTTRPKIHNESLDSPRLPPQNSRQLYV